MESKKHKLLRYLNDSYAAEMGGVASLKDLAAITTDPEVKQAVLDHMAQTKSQADRLANRIKQLGGDKSEPKAIVDTVIAKGSSFTNIGHDRADKQTQDLIKAYALEHFEIGAYTSLYTYATAIGDYETAALADEIRAEEEMAAMRLQRFIPQVARLALDNASEYAPPAKKGWNKAVVPALWLSGAALAAWGVSKLLKEGGEDFRTKENMDTNFGTARSSSGTLSPDLAETLTVQTDTVVVADVPTTPGYSQSLDNSVDNYDINAQSRPLTGATSGTSGNASFTGSNASYTSSSSAV